MYVARRARAIAPERDSRSGRSFVGATAGALFGKAHVLADEVHQAMTSRGYRGDARTLDRFRIAAVDVVALAGAAACILLLLAGDRAL
jgi:cobalt/nickel transport system permease protein